MNGAKNEWLSQLKAGDSVIVVSGSWRDLRDVCVVERVTPTQIKLLGRTYRKRDGYEANDYRYASVLQQATPEACAEIADAKRRRVLMRRIEAAKLKDVPTDRLAAAATALDGAP